MTTVIFLASFCVCASVRISIISSMVPNPPGNTTRSEEHTSELQPPCNLVCRLLLEKKKKQHKTIQTAPQRRPGGVKRHTAAAQVGVRRSYHSADEEQQVEFNLDVYFLFFLNDGAPPDFPPFPHPTPLPI